MLSPEKREELIARLNCDMVDTVHEWARSDYDSLLNFVTEALGLDKLNDDTIVAMYESAFGESFDDEQDCC